MAARLDKNEEFMNDRNSGSIENEVIEIAIKRNPCPKCQGERRFICHCPKKEDGEGENAGGKYEKKEDESKGELPFSAMSFKEFDQLPNGWRKLTAEGKFKEAAEAIVSYLSEAKSLTNYEKCLLHWHAGQEFAKCGETNQAIAHFNLAGQEKDEMIKIFGPAAEHYLLATIAFLERDREQLENQFKAIMAIPMHEYPHSNVVLVPGRVHDMLTYLDEKNYEQIFSLKPSLAPLPDRTEWFQINAQNMMEEGCLVGAYRSIFEKAHEVLQSRSGRSTLISRPPAEDSYPRAKQDNMSSASNVASDDAKTDEPIKSKYSSLPTPFRHRLTKE